MRVLTLLLTAIVLAGCATEDPSSPPSPSIVAGVPTHSAPSPEASTPPSLAPSPGPTVAQPSTPAAGATPGPARPARLAWTRLGTIATGSQGSVEGVRKIAAGYVAWGAYWRRKDLNPRFTTWFSPDGRTWERTVHAKPIVPCPGWTARSDLDSGYSAASDGQTLTFALTLLLPDAEACDRAWMISLSTKDGRTWTRSQPFGPPHDNPAWAMWAESTWAIPGGWESLVSDGTAVVTIWRSTDLATWTQVAARSSDRETGSDFRVLGAAPNGTRLAVSTTGDSPETRATLLASTDGFTWNPMRTLPKGFGVSMIAMPDSAGRPWVLGITSDEPEEARILVSWNLIDWSRARFAKPGIKGLTATGPSWVAVGYWPSRETGCGDSCRPERPSLYTSNDGQAWVRHPNSLPARDANIVGTFGDGDVIAADSVSGEVTMWRLESGS